MGCGMRQIQLSDAHTPLLHMGGIVRPVHICQDESFESLDLSLRQAWIRSGL